MAKSVSSKVYRKSLQIRKDLQMITRNQQATIDHQKNEIEDLKQSVRTYRSAASQATGRMASAEEQLRSFLENGEPTKKHLEAMHELKEDLSQLKTQSLHQQTSIADYRKIVEIYKDKLDAYRLVLADTVIEAIPAD